MAARYRVSTDALNLRAAPGTSGEILTVLVQDEVLTAAGAAPHLHDDGSTWLNVVSEAGVEGWLHSGFVTEVDAEPPATYRVSGGALNLRAGPGIEHESLDVLQDGVVLSETGVPAADADGDEWLSVSVSPGANGWVSAEFVTKIVVDQQMTVGGALAWGARVSPEFRERLRSVATNIGCEADFLMAAMAFETGRAFTPNVRNQWSGATGLIQFMPATALGLGTTIEALARMSAVEQLDVVERYFQPYRGRVRTLEDLYMAILWPAAIGEPNDFPLFVRGTIQYTQNAGLDANGDGIVTKQEAALLVLDQLEEGRLPGNYA